MRNADDFETAFGMIARHRPGALLVTGDAMHQAHIDQIIAFAAGSRVPALYNMKENALAGGLMAYAADHRELYRRAATYVDKILKGVKPADLPFEQPTKFELVPQSQDRQDPRPDDPAVAPAAGGSGDRVSAKRVQSTGREPTTRQTRKAGAPRTSEEIARAATTDPVGLDGVKVNPADPRTRSTSG